MWRYGETHIIRVQVDSFSKRTTTICDICSASNKILGGVDSIKIIATKTTRNFPPSQQLSNPCRGLRHLMYVFVTTLVRINSFPWAYTKATFWLCSGIVLGYLRGHICHFGFWLKFSPFCINIAKGTTDPWVKFCLPKFEQVQTQILIKFLFQNLNQAATSKSQSNISMSTRHKIQNIDQS